MSRSIMEPRGTYECYNCQDTRNLEEHHIFYGPNRKLSEHYGLKVHLCYVCHEDNVRGIHGQNKELRERLQKEGQQAFERTHGDREEFRKIFGKNYL